jgi:hypothetical protein
VIFLCYLMGNAHFQVWCQYQAISYAKTYAISAYHHWVRISIRARCTTLCDKVCQWLATGRWFSLGPPVSSTSKTDRHDIMKYCWKWQHPVN